MKAIILSRVSTQQQDLQQQTEKVKTEALKDGFLESDIIVIEDKESAVKLSEEERNGLNQMKWHIENDQISTVYTYEISRISRQPKMVYSIRDYLIEHHIQLIVLNPYFKMLKDDGTISETSNIFFGIFSSMAENEGFIRKQRFARGRAKCAADGRYGGGPVPPGYRCVNKRLVIHEEEAKVIRYLYDKYANDNMSLNQLGWYILEMGFRGANKIEGARHLVRAMLKRKHYCGDNRYPQIISKELFDAVQDRMKNKIWYRKGNESICKGLIIDKKSNRRLIANVASGQYYIRSPKTDLTLASISILAADTLISGLATEWYNQVKYNKHDELIRSINEQKKHCNETIRNMEQLIIDNQGKIDRIEERYIDGKISKERADALERKVFESLQLYKNKLDEAKNKIIFLDSKIESQNSDIMTLRDKALYVIDHIYLSRLSKYICVLEIRNKITGEERTYTYNTKVKKILHMEVKMQATLNWNGK